MNSIKHSARGISHYSVLLLSLLFSLSAASFKEDMFEAIYDYIDSQYDIHSEQHYFLHNTEYYSEPSWKNK